MTKSKNFSNTHCGDCFQERCWRVNDQNNKEKGLMMLDTAYVLRGVWVFFVGIFYAHLSLGLNRKMYGVLCIAFQITARIFSKSNWLLLSGTFLTLVSSWQC